MGRYVDGFVVPIPKNNVEQYRRLAEGCAKIWKEYGAIDYYEGIADDVPYGEVTSFPRSVQLKTDEVTVFSWIVYNSREDRDRINAAVMKDPRMKEFMPSSEVFDAKRMIYGGFKPLVDSSSSPTR